VKSTARVKNFNSINMVKCIKPALMYISFWTLNGFCQLGLYRRNIRKLVKKYGVRVQNLKKHKYGLMLIKQLLMYISFLDFKWVP